MSGAYGNRFLGSRLCWHVERSTRKIFSSGEQAESYTREHDRAARARFLTAAPRWEAVIAGAKDVEALPFDPFLPNVRLDITRSGEVFEHLELTLAKPPAAGALETLRTALLDAAAGLKGQEVADFRNPVAAIRWGRRFGLYVGLTAEALPGTAAALEPRLRKVLDRLWPIAEAKAAELPFRLGPVKAGGVLDFNPWGPLLDGRFMRESWSVGSVDVRLAFTPATADHRIDLGAWFQGLSLA